MGIEQQQQDLENQVGSDKVEKVKNLEEQPEAAIPKKPLTPVANNKNKTWTFVFVVALLVAIAVCVITIPIVYNNRNEESAVENDIKNDNNSTLSNDNSNSNNSANDNSNVNNSDSSTTNKNSSSAFFQTNNAFVNSTIEVMSASITEGYATEEELEESIQNAVNFQLGIIYNNMNRGTISNGSETADGSDSAKQEPTQDASLADGNTESSTTGGAAAKSPQGDSFDTNNQEQGVEEGDMIVSDGNYVYAAYGKYLVVWNVATGAIVKSFEMPPIAVNYTASDLLWYKPEPYIVSLLLNNGRLLVIASGYEQAYYQYATTGEVTYDHVLYNYLSTNVRLYDTASLVSSGTNVSLESGLIGSKFVNGAWNAVRATNGIAQIVTTSSLNTDEYLVKALYQADSSGQQLGQETGQSISSSFTRRLMLDLKAGGDSLPNLARINSWQTSASIDGRLEELTYRSTGLLSSLVLIHSLDMMVAPTTTDSAIVTTTSSGSFVPAYWVQVYGTNDKIILAANVYEYDDTTSSSKESTGLLAFDIVGATSKPTSVGTVPGYILNSYALDVMGNTLRIATTVRNQTWTMTDVMFATDVVTVSDTNDVAVAETAPAEGTSDSKLVAGSSEIAVDIMPIVPSNFETENFIIIMEMPTSSTGTDTPGTMVEVGRLQIGKPQESITAIRFYDNITYAVTFERTDPFYVLDLSNSTNPTIIAELNITGFSSYLHPMNDEKTLLLAVGEEADANGVSLGLQITIFDASDPRNPVALHRYNIEKDDSTYSYSDAQWDYKAFRYVDGYLFLPVDIGVDWMSTNTTQQPFYGTMMFKVSADTGIEEIVQCRVAHTEEIYNYMPIESDPSTGDSSSSSSGSAGSASGSVAAAPCNYYGYLPRRSMVFNGDLMSIRNSEIIMTDLDTCTRLWNTTITIANEGGCNYRI